MSERSTIDALLTQVREFCCDFHITERTLGYRAIGEGRIFELLRHGGDIRTKRLDQIVAYMERKREERADQEAAQKAAEAEQKAAAQ